MQEQSSRGFLKLDIRLGILIFAGLVGMIMFFGPTDNWAWDPSYYYAQLRSPIIENDLDFRNETATSGKQTQYTVTGLQHSSWPIGPSILWSPFFLLAHLIMLITDPMHADGFQFPYIGLVSLGSVAYGVAGLLMIYRICRYFSSAVQAFIAAVLCFGATPLFFYMFRQPIMAHTTGLFASAAIVLIYMVLSESDTLSRASGLLFGASLGLCFLTRWNGVLMGIVPAIYFANHFAKAVRKRSLSEFRPLFLQVFIMTGVFILMISPQSALWYRLHHRLLVMPQTASSFVGGGIPINLLKVFVDTNRGVFFWSPFVLIGMVGIALIPDTKMKLIAAIVVGSQFLLIGYRVDWHSGGGYGARYYVETLPFIAVGFASLIQKIPSKSYWKLLTLICVIALIAHQFVLMFAVEHGTDDWISLEKYMSGKPIGVRWQLSYLSLLARDPIAWFSPRPFIPENRQTILTNFLSGVRNPQAFLITGTATILTPILVVLLSLFYNFVNRENAYRVFIGIIIYFVGWSVYLFLVG